MNSFFTRIFIGSIFYNDWKFFLKIRLFVWTPLLANASIVIEKNNSVVRNFYKVTIDFDTSPKLLCKIKTFLKQGIIFSFQSLGLENNVPVRFNYVIINH